MTSTARIIDRETNPIGEPEYEVSIGRRWPFIEDTIARMTLITVTQMYEHICTARYRNEPEWWEFWKETTTEERTTVSEKPDETQVYGIGISDADAETLFRDHEWLEDYVVDIPDEADVEDIVLLDKVLIDMNYD